MLTVPKLRPIYTAKSAVKRCTEKSSVSGSNTSSLVTEMSAQTVLSRLLPEVNVRARNVGEKSTSSAYEGRLEHREYNHVRISQ